MKELIKEDDMLHERCLFFSRKWHSENRIFQINLIYPEFKQNNPIPEFLSQLMKHDYVFLWIVKWWLVLDCTKEWVHESYRNPRKRQSYQTKVRMTHHFAYHEFSGEFWKDKAFSHKKTDTVNCMNEVTFLSSVFLVITE